MKNSSLLEWNGNSDDDVDDDETSWNYIVLAHTYGFTFYVHVL